MATTKLRTQIANDEFTITWPELFSGDVSIELEEVGEDEGEDRAFGPDWESVPRSVLGVGVCCVGARPVDEGPMLDGFVNVKGLAELSSMVVSFSTAVGRRNPS